MCEFADFCHKSQALQHFGGMTIQNFLPPGVFSGSLLL